MQPDFKPPKDEAELRERAKLITPAGAKAILSTLEDRRKRAVEAIDKEIEFYKKVIEIKENE